MKAEISRAVSPVELWPAYAGLAVAVGAVLAKLATTFGAPVFTAKLFLMLGFALFVSFTMRSNSAKVRESGLWLLAALVVALPPLALFVPAASFLPPSVSVDSGAFISVVLGWLTIATVFAVGARTGEQKVPLMAPLVPALSLFGVLGTAAADISASVPFVVFAGASLYLATCERTLRHANPVGAMLVVESTAHVALQALAACAVWLLVLLAGAWLFYAPAAAILPPTLTTALTEASDVGRALAGDWRTAPPVVEVRGGNYPLSSKALMRITVQSGTAPGRWRRDVYARYYDSRWFEIESFPTRTISSQAGVWVPLRRNQRRPNFQPGPDGHRFPRRINFNRSQCDSGCDTIREKIEPRHKKIMTLVSSGQPTAIRGNLGDLQVRADSTALIVREDRRNKPYLVQSQLPAPETGALLKSPGLSFAAMGNWRDAMETVDTIDVANDDARRIHLRAIADEISSQARSENRLLDTPARKAIAIGDYLRATCRYSLAAPLVPKKQDAVLFFLQKSRVGACDMFASSMALLLREMNVPSRLVTGFLQPEKADNAAGTVFSITERDAHAWVEYYVPAFGWIAHDPTQGTRTTEMPRTLNWLNPRDWLPIARAAIVPLIGALICALLLISFVIWRKRHAPVRAEIASERIVQIYGDAARLLQRRVARPPHFTPHEYQNAVAHSSLSPEVKNEFAALTERFVHSQYQFHSVPTDLDGARENLKRLRAALKKAGRKSASVPAAQS